MSLVVTGTVGIDTVYTPKAHVEGVLGGSCMYFAAAASFFGRTRMIAAVGDDFPQKFRDLVARFPGIDASGLEVRPGRKTFRWGGKYLQNMNSRETLFTELGVVAEEPAKVPDSFLDARYIFLANSHPASQMGMLERFKHRQLVVADTMDLWINIAKPELLALMKKVDGLVLNYDEAELLTGKANPVAAARHILEMGPRFVVIKKGEHGCLLAHADGGARCIGGMGIASLPAYPAETVVDPTGAGDSFAGGMMGFLASSGSAIKPGTPAAEAFSFPVIRRALAHGTVVASYTIEAFSLDRLTTLTKPELDKRYEEYTSMLRLH
jgi:sugar/nucleoside kinase (ribokinase family)